ncbi:bifunctional indole-3-glycerol-phosphate synthase TrpC/phosphoribosylanthranilate isomerase TrpF [Corynebacterium ureicelerivorans]|uniref:bifunctional indole-3-glycerol-phosphate synthase TrpC/phosphoribosylanthranilate isomerase TrpF n=1 Tax=Corynebacterium ureicelerivorans TaxID=401472 RepID=UPI002353F24E|nr:bifunctional indole-3-glycerol-phosphate synthase TrpC/phosphoribosylanthranilate isomerase TrpF [Corynebacterium ureicelerivorans]
MARILSEIVANRKRHLDDIRQRISHVHYDTLRLSERSLYDALSAPGASYIMECKSASPSLGTIREDYKPGEIASVYSRYASAISVLCEPDYFGGDYDHLATVAATTHLPVLCKDFIIDEVQIYAARYFGADAILLMLSVLSDDEYAHLASVAASLHMDVLTEVIDEEEAARATALGARIFGVNHRNLHDLSIDLNRSARLAQLAPDGAVVVAESGIRDAATVRRLGEHADAFLVGSQLTSQPDIDRACRELVYGPNKVCGLRSASAAQAAKAAGAVYGGLIFEEASPRNVSRETAAGIIAAEPGLDYVAVSRRTHGYDALVQPGITAVQIHAPYQGSLVAERELIERVRDEVDVEVWRAVDMTSASDVAGIAELVDRLVLDSGAGGTGERFDWSRMTTTDALLAGGLTPDNLGEALRTGCLGLDMNSGFEDPRGHKDAAALRRGFATIRNFHY